MKTDKTGLEQVIEWAKKEHEYAIAKIDRSGDSWAKEIVATTEMEAYGKMVDKARALLAAEKAAMEKAQGPIASKPINPVVAAHEAEQGLLRTAIWELIGEMDANIAENRDYPVMASDIVEGLKRELEKNPPEQKPPAPPEKSTQGQWAGWKATDQLINWLEKVLQTTEDISPDPQTQVQQLIQWAKDNGYELAAEWMVDNKIAFLTDEQLQSLSERFGCFQFGDAQGDKSRDFANAVIELSRPAQDTGKENAK